jgi:hypothetical protein
MAKARSNPITYDHFAAFGMIINIVAQIDGLLDQIIIAMVQGQPTILPILTLLGTKDKIDYIEAMAKISTLSPIAADGLERLVGRVRKTQGLRNQIAHSAWMEGRSAGTIKPITMSAKGSLKMLGTDTREKQWTADELKAEATRFEEIGTDLALFMKRYGLVPRMWEKSSGKNSRKSQSRGG